MAKRVVILGSLGTDEDAKAVRAVARFVADTQPDEVVCIEGSTTLLERLREGYGGPLNVHASTTDESFDAVLDRFGARLLPQFNKVAPGWITTRGHRGQISLSRIGGNTALNAAIKFGTSVVVGHTHRLGIGTRTGGFGGNITHQVTGMEVGHLMNQKRAEYLKSGTGNWQMGFGLLTIDGQHVKPETVPVPGPVHGRRAHLGGLARRPGNTGAGRSRHGPRSAQVVFTNKLAQASCRPRPPRLTTLKPVHNRAPA